MFGASGGGGEGKAARFAEERLTGVSGKGPLRRRHQKILYINTLREIWREARTTFRLIKYSFRLVK